MVISIAPDGCSDGVDGCRDQAEIRQMGWRDQADGRMDEATSDGPEIEMMRIWHLLGIATSSVFCVGG